MSMSNVGKEHRDDGKEVSKGILDAIQWKKNIQK